MNAQNTSIVMIAAIAGGSVVVLILVGCLIYFKRKNKIANDLMQL